MDEKEIIMLSEPRKPVCLSEEAFEDYDSKRHIFRMNSRKKFLYGRRVYVDPNQKERFTFRHIKKPFGVNLKFLKKLKSVAE